MSGHNIIVIGASAGGVEALMKLVHDLPDDLPASVFVVLHISPGGPSLLAGILSRSGPLKAISSTDGIAIRPGNIYVAPSDHHLLVEQDRMRVVRGPKENRHRPAIDPLFRSAALTYGPRVIGVVLTGALDDGTAGLRAIKQCGGIAVVQDPTDALYPNMPESALAHVQVDYTSPISEMGALLTRLVHEHISEEGTYPVPEEIERELRLVKMEGGGDVFDEESHMRIGKPSGNSCPECGGVLWELQDGDLLRFRCHVGHAFSTESIQAEQQEALENALFVALKILEENISLSHRLAKQTRQRGQIWLARSFEEKARDAESRARVIRAVLTKEGPELTLNDKGINQ